MGQEIQNSIRNGILNLRFKPGEVISIKALCEVLQAGRTPVRDALIQLEKEGLIVTMPQKGTMISKIDRERAAQEQFIRKSLEEKVLEAILDKIDQDGNEETRQEIDEKKARVTSEITVKLMEKLEAVLKKQKEAVWKKDAREFLALDMQFHQVFFEEAGQQLAFDIVSRMCGHYRRIRLLSLLEPDIMEHTFSQHQDIIKLLREGKKDELRSLMHEHLTKVKQEETILQQRYQDLFVQEERKEQTENPLTIDFLMESNKKGEE